MAAHASAQGISPDEFASLRAGSCVELKSGEIFTVARAPHGRGNAWILATIVRDQVKAERSLEACDVVRVVLP